MNSGIAPRVRELLVCPSCHGELEDVPDGLKCVVEGIVYPVVDGIPHLIAERGRKEPEPVK